MAVKKSKTLPSNPLPAPVAAITTVPETIKEAVTKATRGDLRQQVSRHTPKILSALSEQFGINETTILAAINGDINAAKEIGEMGKIGVVQKQFADIVGQQVVNSIEGTMAVNNTMATIIGSAKSNGLNMTKLENQARLNETNYNNSLYEIETNSRLALTNESQRHKDSLAFIEMKAYVDSFVKGVDQELRQRSLNTSVQQKQLSANKAAEMKLAETWLATGDQRDVDLLETPNYTATPISAATRSLGNIANSIKAALGF